ncbi:hypothetical protein [Polynucleobacter sp. MWH-P3-07-1]|nr:hypothetical protein [Polynucleobacter sp. MWH-P3-07-1]
MKRLVITAMLISIAIPVFARTDGGGKKSSQKYNNPSGHEN